MCYLGIDIGTSSICGVVYHTSSKKIRSITRENGAGIVSSNTWEKAQDAEAIVRIVRSLIDELEKDGTHVRGIGLSGQMHGVLYVDKEGKALSPLYTWQDMRGGLPYKEGWSYASYLSEATGLALSSGFGLVTHFYNLVNGLVPEGATKISTIMDYVAMRLTGREAPLMDASNAASLGFFDKRRSCFDEGALERVGIDTSILPELGDTASLVGYYQRIPVYTAIGDNQASFLGSVRSFERSIHVTVGTSSQLSVYSDTYIEVPSLETRPLPGGGYILVGAALCGGCAFSMLKSFFQDLVRMCSGTGMSDTELYAIMSSVPYKKEASEDIRVDTLFDGTRSHPELRGRITNISRYNWTPENLVLGFLRGMSRELFDFYRLLPSSIRAGKDLLIGSGNGIRKNPLLREILEEYFRVPLRVSKCQEEAALGACLCGMLGADHITRFSDFEYD